MLNSASLDTNIRVAIRVRPLIKREKDCKDNWFVDEDTIYQLNDHGKKVPNSTYTFDRIFGKDKSTLDLYMDFAKPIVHSVMEGYNGTVFAYGQTSSGKTYTMSGTQDSPGIIPYALDEVFDFISNSTNREFLLRVSYMEIYNEIITDLLNPKSTNLKIRENVQGEISVDKLTEKVVTSVQDIIILMKVGEKNRHVGNTNMNEKSSRSHTIFRMVAESRETSSRNSGNYSDFDGAVKVSHLNLVDLAGSERASVAGTVGIRLREGSFINTSLFVLANVINKLSEESNFVPFRDCKLTRILQNSLGGNAKTSIICAVTPASIEETQSTLQFANRAKTIKNRPEVNEVLDDGTMLKRCRKEISELKRALEKSHSREELLTREMELKKEKDIIKNELEEQRRIADETKAKLRELANFFCTPQEVEAKQRKQRRWTVCPMGAHSKPLLQLDLPFGSPSKSLCENPNSVEFHEELHQRFFQDLREREEENNVLAEKSFLGSVNEFKALEQELLNCKAENRKLSTELQAAVSAKEEADVKYLELEKYARELEQKEISTAAETSSTESEELLLKLEEKTEEIEKKSSLIAKLEDDIKELLESKEKLQNECQITKENLKQDFDDQIECLREAVEEKERELFRAQEENVNTLRAELDRERDSVTKLIEERNSLQNDLNSASDELKIIRDHLQAKSCEVLTLENKVNETNQAMDRLKQENEIVVEELQENISVLKTEFGKLVEENQSLKTISETYQVQLQELKDHNLVTETQKELVMSNMDVPSSEASCKSCRRRTIPGKRESDVFKLMLKDIKEQVGCEQDKLVDELNHTLVATQERLEQKEFVLDEKEFEIMEKDELVEKLQKKLAAIEKTTVSEESENVELDVDSWREKLKTAEEYLLQAQQNSEIITTERNALKEKVDDLNNFVVEKSQTIDNLKQELSEAHEKDLKIYDLEMDIDVLQGEITSLKGRSDSDMQCINELKQRIREQEENIVQLEACKAGLTLERDETMAGEMRNLRMEVEDARSRLIEFEEEKNRETKVLQEKNELLKECELNIELLEEDIKNKDQELGDMTSKLEHALQDVKEKDVSRQQIVQELENCQTELDDLKNSFKTVSDELERVNVELYEQQTEHKEAMKKINNDLQVAEGAFKKAMSDKFETDEIVNVKEAECEKYKEKIMELETQRNAQVEELEATKLRRNSEIGKLERHIAELSSKSTGQCTSADCQENQTKMSIDLEKTKMEVAERDEHLRILKAKLHRTICECGRNIDALQECEEEIRLLKIEVEKLEDEKEELKKKFENDVNILEQQRQSSDEKTIRKLNDDFKVSLEEKEAECEKYKEKIMELETQRNAQVEELEATKLRHDSEIGKLERHIAELSRKSTGQCTSADCQENQTKMSIDLEKTKMEVAERDEQLRILKAKLHRTICECGRNIDALQECEEEIRLLKIEVEKLEDEKEELKKKFENDVNILEQQRQSSDEKTIRKLNDDFKVSLEEKEAECEKYKEKIMELETQRNAQVEELEATKLRRDSEIGKLERHVAELSSKSTGQCTSADCQENQTKLSIDLEKTKMEVAERDEQLRILKAKLHRTICECGRNIDALQECEEEIRLLKIEVEKLEDEKEELKKKFENEDINIPEQQRQSCHEKTIRKLNNDFKVALEEKEAECEKYKEKITELETQRNAQSKELKATKLRRDSEIDGNKLNTSGSCTSADCQENQKQMSIDLEKTKMEVVERDQQLRILKAKLHRTICECGRNIDALQECEEEIRLLKIEVEKLEDEEKELKKKFENGGINIPEQQRQSSHEEAIWKLNVDFKVALEGKEEEIRLLKIEIEELKDKKKEMFLQIEGARVKICALEKDVTNHAKKNNDLKAEIRGLRNREDEPTIDMIRGKVPSSSSDENVGVVSTLAVFALNAKVEKLTDENKLVKSKCDSFEKEVCKQKLIYLDLKQKFDKLKTDHNILKERLKQKTVNCNVIESQATAERVPPELVSQPALKDESSKPSLGHHLLKRSYESAFETPRKFPGAVNTAWPSVTSKPFSESIEPRPRQEQEDTCNRDQTSEMTNKQTVEAMYPSNRASKTLSPTLEKPVTFSKLLKQNKENSILNKDEDNDVPDACKTS